MKKVIIAGFLVSLSIEITQLLTALRICDIDDVIFNTTGAIIGYTLYLLIRKVSPKFSSLERLVEDDTQGSLSMRAVKPAVIVILLILSLCAVSFYQNTYSLSSNNNRSIYSNISETGFDGKIKEMLNYSNFTVVLTASQSSDSSEKVSVYIYRNVLFNRAVYIGGGNFKISGSRNGCSSFMTMVDRETILNIVYGKNTGHIASAVEVTAGSSTYNLTFPEKDYFITASTVKSSAVSMKVKLLDSQGNDVTSELNVLSKYPAVK